MQRLHGVLPWTIMLHPGLGDDAANYETELTPYGMKLDPLADLLITSRRLG